MIVVYIKNKNYDAPLELDDFNKIESIIKDKAPKSKCSYITHQNGKYCCSVEVIWHDSDMHVRNEIELSYEASP